MEEGEEVWLHLMRVGWNAASLPYFECLVLQLRNAKMNNWDYVEFTYKWFGWFKDIRTDNDSDLSMNVWVTVDKCVNGVQMIRIPWNLIVTKLNNGTDVRHEIDATKGSW